MHVVKIQKYIYKLLILKNGVLGVLFISFFIFFYTI